MENVFLYFSVVIKNIHTCICTLENEKRNVKGTEVYSKKQKRIQSSADMKIFIFRCAIVSYGIERKLLYLVGYLMEMFVFILLYEYFFTSIVMTHKMQTSTIFKFFNIEIFLIEKLSAIIKLDEIFVTNQFLKISESSL